MERSSTRPIRTRDATPRLKALKPKGGAAVSARSIEPSTPGAARHAVATYSEYRDAERAVDWLSDQGFAVEHVAIVGSGLKSVEQVAGRMTTGRAALMGAGQGVFIGLLFALLFGLFFTGPGFWGLLLYAVVAGAIFGALIGLFSQSAQGGRRDFTSARGIQAERYEVQVDEPFADEARRILDAMPAARL